MQAMLVSIHYTTCYGSGGALLGSPALWGEVSRSLTDLQMAAAFGETLSLT